MRNGDDSLDYVSDFKGNFDG